MAHITLFDKLNHLFDSKPGGGRYTYNEVSEHTGISIPYIWEIENKKDKE